MTRRSLVVWTLVLSLSRGCSFAFTTSRRSARVDRRSGMPSCTTQYLAPGLDTLLVVPGVLVSAQAMTSSAADFNAAITRPMLIAGGLGLALAFTAAAVYGYMVVGDCRDFYTRHNVAPPD
jgi:hypothetical protein